MSSNEDKEKHLKRRNQLAQMLRDQGDHKGAFSLKVVNHKKQEYKRVKLNPRDIYEEEE